MDSENGHLNGSPGSSIRCEKKPLRKEVGSGHGPKFASQRVVHVMVYQLVADTLCHTALHVKT